MLKTIDKNVIMLGFVSFFTDMASAMVTPLLPIFVVTILHEGMDKLGIIIAISTFVSYALRLVSGYISDRYGIVKPLVVGGYFISALSKPLIGFSQTYKSIALLNAMERFGKGTRSAPKDLMISSYSKENAAGKTFGFHKTMDIAGELFGTILLFVALYTFGQTEEVIRNIFYFTLFPGIVSVILVTFFVKDIPKRKMRESGALKISANDKEVLKSLAFYFLFIFFIFSSAFYTMQAKELGISTMMIPLLFVVSAFMQTLSSYSLGKLVDKIGAEYIMAFAYLCGVVSQLFLYLQNELFTWLAFAFLGLFTVASLNATRSLISQKADNKGTLYGLFYSGVAIFGALGALLSGYIWHGFGMDTTLIYAFIGTSIVTLLFFHQYIISFRLKLRQ
ncbi:MAG: MFS transporter [Sulfurimonas sp.]|nr:MFS transporter [Sulfurimonas sp.]